MKILLKIRCLTVAVAAAVIAPTHAAINIPTDGSDGALDITTNTVIDLSQATPGAWSQDNSSHAGNGVYDATQWAVVFKYSSVHIAAGATVSFKNHPTHAPVVWLVQGDCLIEGHVDLDGRRNTRGSVLPTEPGPGGFRGGAISASGNGAGYGPGGRAGDIFGSAAGGYGSTYGNPQIIPLMGGSGNGATYDFNGPFAGPSGGGAILIAARGGIHVKGAVHANLTNDGCSNGFCDRTEYSGAGAIRLLADQIDGEGSISAGVIRTECNLISPALVMNPNTVAVPPGANPQLWPKATAPTVRVLTVHDQSAPADPIAGLATSSDVTISTNAPVDIVLEAKNFPPSGAVSVRILPKYGDATTLNATYVSGDFAQSVWKATSALPNGFCTIQAHATSP